MNLSNAAHSKIREPSQKNRRPFGETRKAAIAWRIKSCGYRERLVFLRRLQHNGKTFGVHVALDVVRGGKNITAVFSQNSMTSCTASSICSPAAVRQDDLRIQPAVEYDAFAVAFL